MVGVIDLVRGQLKKEGILDVKVKVVSQEDFNKRFRRVSKSGVYLIREKMIYLTKRFTGSTVAHEIGHAIVHHKGLYSDFSSLQNEEDFADDYARENSDFVERINRLQFPEAFRGRQPTRFY